MCGLIEVCDVCGQPLLDNQKMGRKASNGALCHAVCLYYTIDGKKITGENYFDWVASLPRGVPRDSSLLK